MHPTKSCLFIEFFFFLFSRYALKAIIVVINKFISKKLLQIETRSPILTWYNTIPYNAFLLSRKKKSFFCVELNFSGNILFYIIISVLHDSQVRFWKFVSPIVLFFLPLNVSEVVVELGKSYQMTIINKSTWQQFNKNNLFSFAMSMGLRIYTSY